MRNGLTIAYTVAFINAALSLVISFGIHLTTNQQVSIVSFINIGIMLAARAMHLPTNSDKK